MREIQLFELNERVEPFDFRQTVTWNEAKSATSPRRRGEWDRLTLDAERPQAGQALEPLNLRDLVLAEEERAQIGGYREVLDSL